MQLFSARLSVLNRPLGWLILIIVYEAYSDFNLIEIISSIFLAIASLWLVGYLSTDIFHACNHLFEWVGKKWHMPHHSCFRSDASIRNVKTFKHSRWSHDFSETSLMLLSTSIFTFSLWYLNIGGWYGSFYGCIHALVGIYNAVRIGCGDLEHFRKTDPGHQPQLYTQPPSEWLVNASAHWRHHVCDINAYFGGKTTLVDKILGTANSLNGCHIDYSFEGKDELNLTLLLHSLEQEGIKINLNKSIQEDN